jgi:hypothetical protein
MAVVVISGDEQSSRESKPVGGWTPSAFDGVQEDTGTRPD